jgi:prepilin-type N-terminal cleavage/methylation domain-containing protein
MKSAGARFNNAVIPTRSASEGTGGNEPKRVRQVSNLPHGVSSLMCRDGVVWRGGFTLVEMLVVLGILLTLAAMTVAFLPTLNNYQKVQSGASRVQGWFLTAKQRALRDQVPRGIRLLVETIGGRQVVRSLQYTEQPEDYSLGLLTVNADMQHATVSGSGVDLSGGFDATGGDTSNLTFWPVQPGDFLMVGTDTTKPIFRITGVNSANFSPSTQANQITTANANMPPTTPTNPAGPYRVIRAPRGLAGEPPLLLPQDVVIDVTGDNDTSGNPRTSQIPNGGSPLAVQYYDLLFASSGAVTGVYFNTGSGSTRSGFPGKVILWMKDITQDMNSSGQSIGQQVLVAVYCRTGLISVHPVDTNSPSTPFDFTQDGQDSGM